MSVLKEKVISRGPFLPPSGAGGLGRGKVSFAPAFCLHLSFFPCCRKVTRRPSGSLAQGRTEEVLEVRSQTARHGFPRVTVPS